MGEVEFKRRKPRRTREEWKSTLVNILVKIVGDTLKAKIARAVVVGASVSVGSYTATPTPPVEPKAPVVEVIPKEM